MTKFFVKMKQLEFLLFLILLNKTYVMGKNQNGDNNTFIEKKMFNHSEYKMIIKSRLDLFSKVGPHIKFQICWLNINNSETLEAALCGHFFTKEFHTFWVKDMYILYLFIVLGVVILGAVLSILVVLLLNAIINWNFANVPNLPIPAPAA